MVQEQSEYTYCRAGKASPRMAGDAGADELVYKGCMIVAGRQPAMLWLLVAVTNSQKGQARCGGRQSNGPCIMLHPNTTLRSTTPAAPLLSVWSRRIRAVDIVSTRFRREACSVRFAASRREQYCPIILLSISRVRARQCLIELICPADSRGVLLSFAQPEPAGRTAPTRL